MLLKLSFMVRRFQGKKFNHLFRHCFTDSSSGITFVSENRGAIQSFLQRIQSFTVIFVCFSDGNKELYKKRKETIERLFGTAKEFHGFRYTNMIGKARMEMNVGLTFVCLNLKKLARMLWKKGSNFCFFDCFCAFFHHLLFSALSNS